MKDATTLGEQLCALLQEHGAAELLRAMSASALGLAEKRPDREDEWIEAAAAAAQAAEALTEGESVADVQDEDEGDEEEEDEPIEATGSSASESPPAPRHEDMPTGPNEGAEMKDYSVLPRRKDVTHWRARRISEDRKESVALVWGDDGIERCEWPIKDLSAETLRARWGEGWYVLQWFGVREDGKTKPLGRGNPIHILEHSPQRTPERGGGAARLPAPPPLAPAAPSASGELLALATMRSQAAGGADMAAMLQLLAFMDERQERQRQAQAQEGRLAAERYRADLEVMLERERLATKERIAQIEATAHAQTRGVRGPALDPEALAEAIGRKVQEAIATDDDDEGQDASPATTLAAPAPSDLATMVNALKETLAPLLAVLATKLVNDPAGGPTAPAPYQPRSGNSHAAE